MNGEDDHYLKKELYRAFKDLPIGICYFDRDLRYMYINDWLAKLNGISAENHLGREIADVLPHVAKHVTQSLRHVINSGEPLIAGEIAAEDNSAGDPAS